MNRSHFQKLSDTRIAEAKILLDNNEFGGGYYLAGYAVECGLKAALLRYADETGEIFRTKKFFRKLLDA